MQACLPTEGDVREALTNIDPVWEVLFPREQERIIRLLVEKVTVSPGVLDLAVRTGGLHALVDELGEVAVGAEQRKERQ